MSLVVGRRLYDTPIGAGMNMDYWKRWRVTLAIKFNSDRRRTARPNGNERRQRA